MFETGEWAFYGPTYTYREVMEDALTFSFPVGLSVIDIDGVLTTLAPDGTIPPCDFFLLGGHEWRPGPLTTGTPDYDRAQRWAVAYPDGFRQVA